jgi:flagellar biosynthesis/type III secretory pathway M-ring protein FliF/YscJ
MERLRQILEQIGLQLRQLSVSQRIAIAACAAAAGASLLLLAQWSASPELVALVTNEFDFDALDAAESALDANDIRYEARGNRIYVRAVDRHNALRVVHTADALPEGSLFAMQDVITDSNPFLSPEARAFAQNYAKGNEVARIISTSPSVKKASVIINPVTKRRVGGKTDVPTASVTVTMAPGQEITPEMVKGFAKLVAGAVAGLKPQNVFITDARTLRSHTLPDPDEAGGFDVLSMIKQHEEHFRSKILLKLADIPGVQAAVTVELDMNKRVTQNVKHDNPQPKTEKSVSSEQRAAGNGPAEAGVQPNLGTAIAAGSEGDVNTSEESSVENFEPKLKQTETIERMPYAVKAVTAAVGIPRSFIVSVFRTQQSGQVEEPRDDDPAFVAVRDAQVARVKSAVERIVMAESGKSVEVDVYPDMEWTAEGGVLSRLPGAAATMVAGESAGDDMISLLRAYGGQVGLGFLALVSLFMVTRVVKKSGEVGPPRRRFPVMEEGPIEEVPLAVGAGPIGQAIASEGMLTGKELDPDTLRHQELGIEVSKLVEQDPAGAADLIRRWIEEN